MPRDSALGQSRHRARAPHQHSDALTGRRGWSLPSTSIAPDANAIRLTHRSPAPAPQQCCNVAPPGLRLATADPSHGADPAAALLHDSCVRGDGWPGYWHKRQMESIVQPDEAAQPPDPARTTASVFSQESAFVKRGHRQRFARGVIDASRTSRALRGCLIVKSLVGETRVSPRTGRHPVARHVACIGAV